MAHSAIVLFAVLVVSQGQPAQPHGWPPELKGNTRGTVTLRSELFLKVPETAQEAVTDGKAVAFRVATTPSTVDLAFHRDLGPDSANRRLWSSWGDICVASDGTVYCGIGDHGNDAGGDARCFIYRCGSEFSRKDYSMSHKILLLASSLLLFATSHTAAQETPASAGLQEGTKAQRLKISDNVTVVRDIVYAKYGEREVQLDLYLPKQPSRKPMPCVVVIHGGGWRSGDKQRFAPIAARLAENGFAAACIGYRLLPEVTFPSPVEDCKAAVRWVRANASKYSIDPDRIGAMGGSAGAHLTAMLATSHKAADLEGNGGSAGVSSRIQGAVAMATPADMSRFAERSNVTSDLATLISPLTHVDADSAPILLIHSNADKTVPFEHSERLQTKYKQAGVRVELVTIQDAPHAFWNSPQWFDDTLAKAVKFFNETLNAAKSR